jgi:hypothetical protein
LGACWALRLASVLGSSNIATPLGQDARRHMLSLGAVVGPVDEPVSSRRAEARWHGPDTDAAQIEPVGVPADLHGQVAGNAAVRVQPAGLVEQFEAKVIEVYQGAPQRGRQLGSPVPMAVVSILVHSPRIVKDSEQRHDLSVGTGGFAEPQAVLEHPGPVCQPVGAVVGQDVTGEDGPENRRQIVIGGWHGKELKELDAGTAPCSAR